MAISFAKAVKYEAKGRIALIGPAGSGKSFTMLTAARALAGPDGKIAAIDTEGDSLSKYADQFDFDVCPLSEFTAPNYLDALHTAEKAGYSVFCVDSLSHFWMGKGGTLEFVDAATARSRRDGGDNMAGWKEFRPFEREMVDAMLRSPLHIICTMRTKTAYEEQVNPRTGKKQRVKIGLAPVQRDGLEYEFDLVGSMTEDNVFVVDKTRCSLYTGKAIDKPKQKDFEPFAGWLSGAPRPEAVAKPTLVAPQAAPPVPVETKQAAPGPVVANEIDLDNERVKWLEAITPLSSDEFVESIGPLLKEKRHATLFVRCIDPNLLAVVCNRLPNAEVFSAVLVPIQKVAFDAGRKDLIKGIAAEAKRRGYRVDRTNGTYLGAAMEVPA
jgi:hypothetical protein